MKPDRATHTWTETTFRDGRMQVRVLYWMESGRCSESFLNSSPVVHQNGGITFQFSSTEVTYLNPAPPIPPDARVLTYSEAGE